MENHFDPPLDKSIKTAVEILQRDGVETFESCQGGNGHAYPEPTIRFHGHKEEGFRAVAVALNAGLNVAELRRVYSIEDGELKGPWWELTFTPTKTT